MINGLIFQTFISVAGKTNRAGCNDQVQRRNTLADIAALLCKIQQKYKHKKLRCGQNQKQVARSGQTGMRRFRQHVVSKHRQRSYTGENNKQARVKTRIIEI